MQEEMLRVESLLDTKAVETDKNIVLLISKEIKTIFQQKLLELNTIQIEQLILHF